MLARFTFSIEYQNVRDNAATDALSGMTLKLNADIMKSILHGFTVGKTERADTQDLVVAKADEDIHKPVQETVVLARAAQTCRDLHVIDWMTNQQQDPILKTVIEWISNSKVQDLKHLLGDDAQMEEGKTTLQEQKKLIFYQGALNHGHTPIGKLEEVGCCACYMTSSDGQAWLCRCRRQSAAASDTSSMKVVISKPQCN